MSAAPAPVTTPTISVCLVTAGRHELLAGCVEALAGQRDAPAFEVLVALDEDPAAAAIVRRHLPGAGLVDVRGLTPGGARNVLAARVRGAIVLYLDDDVLPGSALLARLWELARSRPAVSVFGGPNLTPRSSSRLERSQGEALASLLGAGPLRDRFRLGPAGAADERQLMLCNLAIRGPSLLPFPEDLRTAEENAVLAALTRGGARMHHDPALAVRHHRRRTYAAFARQVHGWGIGRAQLARREPATLRPFHLAPTALLAYLVLLPLLLALMGPWTAGPAAGYAVVLVVWSLAAGRRTGSRMLCVLLLHLAYGAGLLRGLVAAQQQPTATPEVRWRTSAS